MIRKLQWILLLSVALIICATVWVLLRPKIERQRQSVEMREALRKTAEFLKPDTTSDLRFGKKASGATPPATPEPASR